MSKKAIIIGAGPAGLTAAYELLQRTDIIPIILEKSGEIGGISKTVNYKGNRMDMGPHRFFSKSDRVMDWWLKMMPLEAGTAKDTSISYHNKTREMPVSEGLPGKDPEKVMLVIQRLTRIYFLRKFFAYPIQLSFDTLRTLGLLRTMKILFSFLWIRLFPRKPENSLEDFIINKFGRQLYLLFFKDYTEKVWGRAPSEISAEWGAQRIKGVSLSKAVAEAVKSLRRKKTGNIGQKDTETSLIEQFLYPKYGPGSLWEEVARQVQEMGGKVCLHQDVTRIQTYEGRIHSVNTVNSQTGQTNAWEGDFFFSTMPVQELIAGMGEAVPTEVRTIAGGLQYRDFVNVGILLRQLSTEDGKKLELKDNWIYIQERDVKVGRLMVYNNWGTGMIKDPGTTWIGMEYFCNKTDAFWAMNDENIQAAAIRELVTMDLARAEDVLDITVRRMEKTYPAYFGTYNEFDKIRTYTDTFENLFLVGRNGMHKYNNADHSMLTAMAAVDNIAAGVTSKANIWSINTEQEYHEETKRSPISENTKTRLQEKPKQQTPIPTLPFLSGFIFKQKQNKRYLTFAIFIFITEFLLFKIYYPYANYMPDSYAYLDAAFTNADVNIWPVAYSKFLRLVSVFSHSDLVVTSIQFIFLQLSVLFFFFTVVFFFNPKKVAAILLYIFVVLNPLPIYISNYISSDALFIGLSLLWFSVLVWIIFRPRRWQIYVHALLLVLCFTVRYNAIIYPIISCLVYLLSGYSPKRKIVGIGLGLAMVAVSIGYTTVKMTQISGKKQFSPFGGWQLANNALYMYQKMPDRGYVTVPTEFKELASMVRQHLDTLSKVKYTREDSVGGYFYLWSYKGPLVQYMIKTQKKDSASSYFKRWASEGTLYKDYGLFLIKNHPFDYVRYFVFGNINKYLLPPLEVLGFYNMGSDSVRPIAKTWFNYKSLKVRNNNDTNNSTVRLIKYSPLVGVLVTLLFWISIFGLFLFTQINLKENISKIILIVTTLFILNFGFSVCASAIVLRYEVFPTIIFLVLSIIFMEHIYQVGTMPAKNSTLV